MASIQKNFKTTDGVKVPTGTWTAVVYVGRDANGKVLRKQITCDSEKECKKEARKLEDEIESKSLNNLSLMKMSDYMDKWYEVNKPLLAHTTMKTYKLYIEYHFKPFFEKMKVSQITEMKIKEYIADKLKTLSTTTVRKHYFTLSKMFYDAMKTKSPCIDIKAPKSGEFKATIPTEQEFKNICLVFKTFGIEDEAIILLAGWCGLRRGEIFALKWDDIDEKLGTIRIDEAVAIEEEGYKFEFKEPKSHNGIRTVAAPDYLMNLLKEIKQIKPKKKSKKKDHKKETEESIEIVAIKNEVFSYNPHTFTKKYARTIKDKQYNLAQVRFHDLRHYHACLLYKNNVPDLYAAERLGHDIMVLKTIYQHLGLEEKQNLDEKIKGIFKNE